MTQITAAGEEGRSFGLSTLGEASYGDLRVSFSFELPWAHGNFLFSASESRLDEFMRSILSLNSGRSDAFSYISDEGNVEITVKPTGRGDAEIEVVAIPSMATSERIKFEVEGTISCSQ
jgi:hypothetical protein